MYRTSRVHVYRLCCSSSSSRPFWLGEHSSAGAQPGIGLSGQFYRRQYKQCLPAYRSLCMQVVRPAQALTSLGHCRDLYCTLDSARWLGPQAGLISSSFGGHSCKVAASQASKTSTPSKAPPVYTRLTVQFLEAILGAQKTLQAEILRVCPDCKGRRARPGVAASTCGFCRGTGRVLRSGRGVLKLLACMTAVGCQCACRVSGYRRCCLTLLQPCKYSLN